MLLEDQLNRQKVADEAAATKQERERKLAVIDQEIEEMKNAELDKSSPWYKDQMRLLEARRTEALTDLNVYVPQEHKVDSGFTRTVIDPATGAEKEEPIMSAYFVNEKGDLEWTRNGKDIAAHNFAKSKQEALNMHNARTSNINEGLLEVARQNAKSARLKEENARDSNRIKESGADVDPIAAAKKAHGTAAFKSLLDERKLEIKADLERRPGSKFDRASPAQQEVMVNEELRRRDDEKLPGTPTKGEVQEESIRRYERTQPTSDEELDEQAMYEAPTNFEDEMEPEFSDEQFAGTEPAGLYDPTGQPLQMEGGMYSGFA
jgi:hypothetical protein